MLKLQKGRKTIPNIEDNQTSFNEVLTLIQKAKRKVYQQANATTIELYWDVGDYVSNKVTKARWGKGVVKELAAYIKAHDPTIGGFSDKNIWRMKQFYETYKETPKLSTLWSQLNWSNNRTIFSRCKTKEEREFYLNFTYKEGWNNRELERQINASLFERVLLADSNLSDVVKSLPHQIAFELKIDKFKPGYLGQLEFYLEALDRDVKKEHENPSIGVLLCKDKTHEVVEYALSRSVSPMVIADYETELIPKELLKQKVDELFQLYDEENE